MAEIRQNIRRVVAIPEDVSSPRSTGARFDHGAGFAIEVKGGFAMSVFVDQRVSPAKDRKTAVAFLGREGVIAACVSCVGEQWIVRSEPTDQGRSGLTIFTAKGKPIAAGEARVGRTGQLTFRVATLYDRITNKAKWTYTVEGTGHSDGSWEVKGSVSVSR